MKARKFAASLSYRVATRLALLDPVEEAIHQIARPVQIWAETNWVLAISLWRNVGPRTVLTGECSDPVRIL
jgi:hypothetical protein